LKTGFKRIYPNFKEIPNFTGPVQARNFEVFRESLAANGMLDQARDHRHINAQFFIFIPISIWPSFVYSHMSFRRLMFKEIPNFTGPVQARNFEVFRESLAANGMLDQADDFFDS